MRISNDAIESESDHDRSDSSAALCKCSTTARNRNWNWKIKWNGMRNHWIDGKMSDKFEWFSSNNATHSPCAHHYRLNERMTGTCAPNISFRANAFPQIFPVNFFFRFSFQAIKCATSNSIPWKRNWWSNRLFFLLLLSFVFVWGHGSHQSNW